MRIILFLAATFITFVTALPVLAQTPGAPDSSPQQYVMRDGKWMVCVGGECKPLSKKACDDNYSEREKILLDIVQQYQSPAPGYEVSCGPNDGRLIKGLIDELLLENFYRQKVCLQFAEDTTVRVKMRINNDRQIERMSTSSSSKTSGKSNLSAPAIAPAGLLESGADGAQQGPSPTGKPSGPAQASPALRSR